MRILVILLVIGILLFVVLMVWGARMNDSQKSSRAYGADAQKFLAKPHPYLDAFQGILRPFSPTLKASFLRPAITTFDLASKSAYKTTVLRDDEHKFRQAKFVVQPTKSCARITYTASDSNAGDLGHQDSQNDTGDPKHPNELTLTILKGGGQLTVARYDPLNAAPCIVSLK
jgi:hypothetical protein